MKVREAHFQDGLSADHGQIARDFGISRGQCLRQDVGAIRNLIRVSADGADPAAEAGCVSTGQIDLWLAEDKVRPRDKTSRSHCKASYSLSIRLDQEVFGTHDAVCFDQGVCGFDEFAHDCDDGDLCRFSCTGSQGRILLSYPGCSASPPAPACRGHHAGVYVLR